MSSRPHKRSKTRFGGTCYDQIPLEDDLEVIQHRTVSLTGPNSMANSYDRYTVNLPWTYGKKWAPEQNYEFSLDPDNDWHDETLEAEVADVITNVLLPKKKKARSQASVSISIYCYLMFPNNHL